MDPHHDETDVRISELQARQEAETRTATISADYPVGDYFISAAISDIARVGFMCKITPRQFHHFAQTYAHG